MCDDNTKAQVIKWAKFHDVKELVELFTCKKIENPCLHVKTLDLSYKRLHELPEFLFEFSELENLDISHNHIKHLPDKITKLTNLIVLDISWNHILKIPLLPEKILITTAYNRI